MDFSRMDISRSPNLLPVLLCFLFKRMTGYASYTQREGQLSSEIRIHGFDSERKPLFLICPWVQIRNDLQVARFKCQYWIYSFTFPHPKVVSFLVRLCRTFGKINSRDPVNNNPKNASGFIRFWGFVCLSVVGFTYVYGFARAVFESLSKNTLCSSLTRT